MDTEGKNAVVVVNVVGGVADMSAAVGAFDGGRTQQAWEEFFARMPDATVREDEHALVCTIADLGYTIMYSTTFPASTSDDTTEWLAVNDFPEGALLCRALDDLRPAARVKATHCRTIRDTHGGLAGFIDDHRAAVSYLRNSGNPAFLFDYLLEQRLGELRAQLDTPPPPARARKSRRRTAGSTPALTLESGLLDQLRAATTAKAGPDGWANLSNVCNWIRQRHAAVDVTGTDYPSLGRFILGCGEFEVDHRDGGPDRSAIPYVRVKP
ncbi:OST-HTH/LOTUS domain [Nocardia otitidiscaviarum]|uniref:OST-HTH/LOTUS domain n=1 Tax=Nocardia otitidiscaviarum TaxID=1823 RepID=A0A379JNF6_9NOCA|nr:OST-HTH/LOTUS domain-containing protein [Nocardia otitidiscaviarum]SUD49553.1 OST-HTH/LOTUS domain [Nocardia otitidiscaviarum]